MKMYVTILRKVSDKLTKIVQTELPWNDGDELDEALGRRDAAELILDRITHTDPTKDGLDRLEQYVKQMRDQHICSSCNMADWEYNEIWAQKTLAREIAVDLEPQMDLFQE